MTKEQKKLNRDEKMRRRFFKNLRKFCEQNSLYTSEQKSAESKILSLENNERFNPVLNWKYRAVCTCEFAGFRGLYCFRHNRLFGRNARLLYTDAEVIDNTRGNVSEANEVWLLDDMTLAFTHCTEYCNDMDENVCYRYTLSEKYGTAVPYFDLADFLNVLADSISDATICFEE